MTEALLEVDDLAVEFRTRRGVVRAVNGISYQVHRGETVAILGESGAGKSVAAQAVMGILDSPAVITGGSVRLSGQEILGLSPAARRTLRGRKIAMVFQDALAALHPLFPVGWQIAEMFRQHHGMSRRDARQRAIALLERVHIPSARQRVDALPHEFSGGMRQRALIAMAIALDPDVLIADEPTTALDVTVQAQILDLLRELQADTGMGMVLVTHDLGVVAGIADHVAVMYAGRIVEHGSAHEIFADAQHPYTLALMASVPQAIRPGDRLNPIPGTPPDASAIPNGCAFHTRCPFAVARCLSEVPVLRPVTSDDAGHAAACHELSAVRLAGC